MNTRLVTGARYLLAAILLTFSINYFVPFLPQPAMPEPAMAFFGAMMATGYLLPLVKLVELSVGVLLLANRYVPLALVLLAPVSVNIIAFHLFLAPAGILPGLMVFLLNAGLLWAHRPAYASLLRARPEGGTQSAPAEAHAPAYS